MYYLYKEQVLPVLIVIYFIKSAAKVWFYSFTCHCAGTWLLLKMAKSELAINLTQASHAAIFYLQKQTSAKYTRKQ